MTKFFNYIKNNPAEIFLLALIAPVLAMMVITVGITMFGFAYSFINLFLL